MQPLSILITGGNDGIGRAAAQLLLERGHHVILLGRSPVKLEAAKDTLVYRTGSQLVDTLVADLADMSSIQAAATEFYQRFTHLDVLVNNAGMFTNEYAATAQGYEMQWGVNYLGAFLLTRLLLPALSKADAPRIVNVSSAAHFYGRLALERTEVHHPPAKYDGLQAYAQSKLALVLFTRELARRYPDIRSNCLHPGVIRRRFANKNARTLVSWVWTLYKPFMRSPHYGANRLVYLAVSPEIEEVSGRYFDDKFRCRKPLEVARDPEQGKVLWEWSEKAVLPYLLT
ncbi:MAG: SDR family NAD(P)-dependent oxidoreductase [Saprospiraceae bacterium]